MKQIKAELASAFDIVDIKPLAFYVGLKVLWDPKQRTIKLLQPSYIKKLLKRHEILKDKTSKILMQKAPLVTYKCLSSLTKRQKRREDSIYYIRYSQDPNWYCVCNING